MKYLRLCPALLYVVLKLITKAEAVKYTGNCRTGSYNFQSLLVYMTWQNNYCLV